jgi:hypothetical protein
MEQLARAEAARRAAAQSQRMQPNRAVARPQQAVMRQRKQPRKQQRIPAPPPLPAKLREELVTLEAETAPTAAVSPSRRQTAAAGSATAANVRRWLRPETLRGQFILTEVLQPPLALREPRE